MRVGKGGVERKGRADDKERGRGGWGRGGEGGRQRGE